MTFSLLTLNLWNINEPLEARYGALEAGLKALRPDIICLQEVDHDPRSARSQSGLVAEMGGLAHVGEKGGLATLSRFQIVRSYGIALPEFRGDAPRWVLLTECRIDERRLLVANTHLAYPPEMTGERKKQVQAVLPAIKQHSRQNRMATLLCGDFNDVARSPAIAAILQDGEKFRDLFAECNPASSGITYSPRDNPYVDPRWTEEQRIDYIFADDRLAAGDCSVVFDGKNSGLVSDHFGVFATLTFAPSSGRFDRSA